ncbi:uncharacterized protein O3C94_008471 [Discoglossus pictus]
MVMRGRQPVLLVLCFGIIYNLAGCVVLEAQKNVWANRRTAEILSSEEDAALTTSNSAQNAEETAFNREMPLFTGRGEGAQNLNMAQKFVVARTAINNGVKEEEKVKKRKPSWIGFGRLSEISDSLTPDL